MGNLEPEARVSTWTESETLILIEEFGKFQMYDDFLCRSHLTILSSQSIQWSSSMLCCATTSLYTSPFPWCSVKAWLLRSFQFPYICIVCHSPSNCGIWIDHTLRSNPCCWRGLSLVWCFSSQEFWIWNRLDSQFGTDILDLSPIPLTLQIREWGYPFH